MCLLCSFVYPPALENSKNLHLLSEWVGGWVDECLYVYMDGWVDGWMDGWLKGQMDGWVDRWRDRWMDVSWIWR